MTDGIEHNEHYFRALIENAADAITVLNADGTARYSSPAVERILGYTPGERYGRLLFEIVHPEDIGTARSKFQELLERPSDPVAAVLRGRHKDGSWRYIEFRGRNLLSDPHVAGIVVNWRDVSDHREIDERIKQREHFFRTIIERSSDLFAVVDETGLLRYLSPSVHTVLGHEPAELIGTTAEHLYHPDDKAKASKIYETLLEGGAANASAELRVLDSMDRYHTFDVRFRNLLNDPLFRGVVINARDVTETKRTEEALRTSEERFRKIIETAAEGVGIRDPSGRLTFVNERMAQMLGYSVKELLGKSIYELVAPEFRAKLMESGERRRKTGRSDQTDIELLRRDGGRVAILLSASPLYDADGHYVGALGMLMDITERKQLEAHLRQSQKIEAVGRLAGGVAHDFNNLLTAIRGHVDLLLAEMASDSILRPDVEEIRSAAERAAGLTQQLLAFSRRQLLQPRVLELDQVVQDVDTLLRRMIGEDIQLLTHLHSQGARVRADRSQIEQVLMNLAVNARDAMPNGGVLTIDTSIVEIDEVYAQSQGMQAGPHICLCFSDTGSGMSAETLSHVFEPFFTTKELGKGTGLGLATVYGIVKQSGGSISVESEIGSGTYFQVLLPMVDAPSDEPLATQALSSSIGGGETILVAEDEDAVRALAVRILRKRGYHVLEARNGVEAIEMSRNHRGSIDLLLTDVVMPLLGGRELAEQLSEMRPEAKILFMSGYTDDALLQRGVLQGNGRFLEKPFTPDALATKVRQVLEENH